MPNYYLFRTFWYLRLGFRGQKKRMFSTWNGFFLLFSWRWNTNWPRCRCQTKYLWFFEIRLYLINLKTEIIFRLHRAKKKQRDKPHKMHAHQLEKKVCVHLDNDSFSIRMIKHHQVLSGLCHTATKFNQKNKKIEKFKIISIREPKHRMIIKIMLMRRVMWMDDQSTGSQGWKGSSPRKMKRKKKQQPNATIFMAQMTFSPLIIFHNSAFVCVPLSAATG